MLSTLTALALALQTTPPVDAVTTPPVVAPVVTLVAKWPTKAGEASEDIAGVVAKGTPIFKWSEGHNFTEGPACAADGTVYFVDIPANEILRVDPMGAAIVSKESNATFGLYIAKDGTLYGAQANPGAITKIDPKSGAIEVICDKRTTEAPKSGKSLGRLNDLVVDDDGGIWFTAPVIGRKREGGAPDAVYFVPSTGGEATEVICDEKVRAPNGIHLSADGKTLLVVPYFTLDIMAYPIEGPGKLATGRVFYSIPSGTRETIGGDGLTVDAKGNVYVVVPPRAAVFVLSPEGKPLGQIRFPERTSNCALGGKDGKTLYVTASSGVYAIDVANPRAR